MWWAELADSVRVAVVLVMSVMVREGGESCAVCVCVCVCVRVRVCVCT